MRIDVNRIFTFIILVGVMFFGITGEADGKEFSKAHSQLMEKLESLQPGKSIKVLIATAKDTYYKGDDFELRFQVNKDSYVILMHISTEGDITFFAPSHWMDSKVTAGQVYSTITDFNLPVQVGPPGGIETINLFCSTQQIELFETVFDKNNQFYRIEHDDDAKLNVLAERLGQLERVNWAGSGLVVTIIDPDAVTTRALPGVLVPPIGTTGTSGRDTLFPPIGTTGTTGHSGK